MKIGCLVKGEGKKERKVKEKKEEEIILLRSAVLRDLAVEGEARGS